MVTSFLLKDRSIWLGWFMQMAAMNLHFCNKKNGLSGNSSLLLMRLNIKNSDSRAMIACLVGTKTYSDVFSVWEKVQSCKNCNAFGLSHFLKHLSKQYNLRVPCYACTYSMVERAGPWMTLCCFKMHGSILANQYFFGELCRLSRLFMTALWIIMMILLWCHCCSCLISLYKVVPL